MRIYSNAHDLMSEMGRELSSYGKVVKPKTYQNKNIEGNDDFITKEIICQQYCLTGLPDMEWLFAYTNTLEWAMAEFAERIDPTMVNPGDAYLENPLMWSQFLREDGKFDYTYSERLNRLVNSPVPNGKVFTTNLDAIVELLKNDPDTRKAVLPIFDSDDASHYDGSARIPCSVYYDFLIRENSKGEKQLNICYHQRSSDFCMHFGDDVYLAWRLMEYIANLVGIKPGYLYHTIDSLHVYKKDWNLLKSSIDDVMFRM